MRGMVTEKDSGYPTHMTTTAILTGMELSKRATSIPPSITFKNPEIVVGVAGIYDMRLLRDNNSHPAYQEFLVSAFGENEKDWDKASPANHDFSKLWPEAKTVVVVSSKGDELVDEAQIECMGKRLESLRGVTKFRVLKGFLDQNHNGIWEQGVGLAGVIVETLKVWVGDE